MKKPKITKRDILFFFLGFFTLLLLEAILDWEGSKKAFTEGYNESRNAAPIERTN